MKPEWKAFLEDAGAEWDVERETIVSFGNAERERRLTTQGEVLCDLSHKGLIAAYGEEAESFLQGQLTNDVQAVSSERSQLSAYCTPKGRMLAIFRLFHREETYYLRLPREILEATLKRLRMYVLRSKVTLEEASDALVRFGVAGPQAAERLAELMGSVPAEIDGVVSTGEVSLLRVPGIHPRYELYGELEAMQALWSKLNVHAAPVGAANWDLLELLAGIPTIYPETVEAFVPQTANLELVNGLSFHKGCYPGQEIVARSQYLGKIKRRMYRVDIACTELPRPGDELFGERSEEAIGRLVDTQRHPEGGCAALAVLQSERSGELLRTRSGDSARLVELPYALVSESS